jgi:hypothetical protein
LEAESGVRGGRGEGGDSGKGEEESREEEEESEENEESRSEGDSEEEAEEEEEAIDGGGEDVGVQRGDGRGKEWQGTSRSGLVLGQEGLREAMPR